MKTTSLLAMTLLSGAVGCATRTAGPPLLDTTLETSRGESVSLGEVIASHDATVLVWWASTCPCVKRYRERVAMLAERHAPNDVAFFYVSSNADDDLETMREAEGSWPLPMVRDEGQRLATTLGVISTPTVVIVDRDGRVRFQGWFDNERRPGERGREAWVEDALDELLAGRGDALAKTPVWGCTVTRSLGQAGRCRSAPGADKAGAHERSEP